MRSHELKLFADYFQFYIQDEVVGGDLSDAWTPEAVERMLAVSDGVVGFRTARNMDVPITLEFLGAEPKTNMAAFDHIADGSLVVKSGIIVVAGCTEDFAGAARFDLWPGTYRVRLSSSGFATLSGDGLEGQDHYLIQLWQAPAVQPTVLKQGAV